MEATYTTEVHFTPEMLASARRIGEMLISMHKKGFDADAFRATMREERDRWGDDMFEVIKSRGICGASGGRA